MRRRAFIAALGSATALAVRAQQPALNMCELTTLRSRLVL